MKLSRSPASAQAPLASEPDLEGRIVRSAGLIPLATSGGPLWEPLCYVHKVGMFVTTVVTLVIHVIFVEYLKLVGWEWKTPEPAAVANPAQDHA